MTESSAPGTSPAAPQKTPSSGLIFRVAQNLDDVQAAWGMVYKAYRRIELIHENPQQIHTTPLAVDPRTAVIVGSIGPVIASTLTAILDDDSPLPLDRIYQHELDTLRKQDRKLIEVGLFADRRQQLARTAQALYQLMRYAFHYGIQNQVTDFVIGVHPRHAPFYIRGFGFDYFGQTRTYPAVNNHPVVMLRNDMHANLKLEPLPPAMEYSVRHPVEPGMFDQRFGFTEQQLAGSPLAAYLQEQHRIQNLSQTG